MVTGLKKKKKELEALLECAGKMSPMSKNKFALTCDCMCEYSISTTMKAKGLLKLFEHPIKKLI